MVNWLSITATSVVMPFIVALLAIHTRVLWQLRVDEQDWWDNVIADARAVEEVELPSEGEPDDLVEADKREAIADELESVIGRLSERKNEIESTDNLRRLITEIENLYRDNRESIGTSGRGTLRIFVLFSVVGQQTRQHAEEQRPRMVWEWTKDLAERLRPGEAAFGDGVRESLLMHLDVDVVTQVENEPTGAVLDDCLHLLFQEDGWVKALAYDRPADWGDDPTPVQIVLDEVTTEQVREDVYHARSVGTIPQKEVLDMVWKRL